MLLVSGCKPVYPAERQLRALRGKPQKMLEGGFISWLKAEQSTFVTGSKIARLCSCLLSTH